MEVSADEEARAYYESELIFKLDQRGKFREAREEGREEGRKEGREEERIEMAKNLLDVLDIDIISKKFKLTADEIKTLKKDR